MIVIKNKQAIEKMRSAGHLLAAIFEKVPALIVPGTTTAQIDAFIEAQMRESGLTPACKGYAGYQHASCISVNDIVVHGVPSDSIVLQAGDCISVDVVGAYKGYHADMARTYMVGKVAPKISRLAAVAQQSLDIGLSKIRDGVLLGEVTSAIQEVVEDAGFGVVRDFVGHGIGRAMHEDPQVPNFGKVTDGPVLHTGMTLAIEPMITEKNYAVEILADNWSVQTRDGGWAAHVEDTVVVLPDGVEILTRIDAKMQG